jgi:tetratricopeptide (TPR) repeat protein
MIGTPTARPTRRFRALLVIMLGWVCAAMLDAAPAQAAKLHFGTQDYLDKLQDVDVKGPNGEALYLAHKYSFHSFIAPYRITDDGYVLAVKGRDAFFRLDADRIKALQARGLLPSPLPPYQLTLVDYAMGHALWGVGLFVLASIPLSMRAKRRRKRALPYLNDAFAHHRAGDVDRAIDGYTKAIEVDPKLALAFDMRGRAFEAKGETGKAVADYTKAIGLEPKLDKALLDRARLMRNQGHIDAAISDYNKLINLTKDPAAYLERGTAFLSKDDVGRAIKDFTAAIKMAPSWIDAYRCRGAAYLKNGQLDLAKADLVKATAIAGIAVGSGQQTAHGS